MKEKAYILLYQTDDGEIKAVAGLNRAYPILIRRNMEHRNAMADRVGLHKNFPIGIYEVEYDCPDVEIEKATRIEE